MIFFLYYMAFSCYDRKYPSLPNGPCVSVLEVTSIHAFVKTLK